MDSFAIPVCTAPTVFSDSEFRDYFWDPLCLSPPTLPRRGYLRALELYGNEASLRRNYIFRRFTTWAAENRDTHQNYQSYAESKGYNIHTGFAKPYEGLYFKTRPTNVDCKPRQPDTPKTDPQGLLPHPGTPETTQDGFTPISSPHDSVGEFPQPRAIPEALKRMSGARHADPEDIPATCVGAAEIALVLAEMLEFLTNPDISEDAANQCRKSVRETLDYLGGKEGIQKFVDVIYQEFPQHDSSNSTPKFGSTLRG